MTAPLTVQRTHQSTAFERRPHCVADTAVCLARQGKTFDQPVTTYVFEAVCALRPGPRSRRLRAALAQSVHPRACGEHGRGGRPVRPSCGSSPRMRGTRIAERYRRPLLRFIPAHAGNTSSPEGRSSPDPVHPRACGEHCAASAILSAKAGSSPRMRGTLLLALRPVVKPRFIPAHAGNTRSKPPLSHNAGSSPRMRGTRGGWRRACRQTRFIPAPAGNTSSRTTRRFTPAVHPRACGEHSFRVGPVHPQNGSSPRMRGTPILATVENHIDRFIPAHAGNTETSTASNLSRPVHPRACGEHPPPQPSYTGSGGSSPRMRGTRVRQLVSLPRDRFIPAHAGNTIRGTSMPRSAAVHPRARGEHGGSRSPPPCGLVHPRACGEHALRGQLEQR